jgi:hypothetical protein
VPTARPLPFRRPAMTTPCIISAAEPIESTHAAREAGA